ncbi:alpha/beta fold hydrolase [Streptomyces sp. NPDC056191]|uniref:alpha/beta fold hydrolase n=1 Tax=Streptomyces sp. NPDC056191 TaxID=3345742 RepID=UPI0035E0D34E
MARVVVVHGVGQEYLGRRTLQAPVAAALADGVELAAEAGDVPAGAVPAVEHVDIAFYGDAFRTPGAKSGPPAPLSVSDVTDPYEQQLLLAWADAAARGQEPRSDTKTPTPEVVQRAMNALLRSPFVPGAVAERFLLGVLRQVRRYFGEDAVRARALEAVAARVGPDTTVLVGHSLGSVVAYEALCAHPEWRVRTLVTLGSPLGMPSLVFDKLRPAPQAGRGHWPEGLAHWTNLADRHDVVASVKELAGLFRPADGTEGGTLRDVPVDNGWKVHDLLRHLTARETGSAIGEGLRAG